MSQTSLVNKYIMLERIGVGGYGVVFKGFNNKTKTLVAIKTVQLDEDIPLDAIRMEVQILSQCQCSNIITYYESFVHETKLWIIMELINGANITDLCEIAAFAEPYVAIILREVLQALDYLHNQGFMHRDIKGLNVLLNEDGAVKLADFGAAGELPTKGSKCDSLVGTAYWIAPEVAAAEPYDSKADIWSVGILAMEMIEGDPPYIDKTHSTALMLIAKNPPPVLNIQTFSKDFQRFIKLCLLKEPRRRPTAKKLLQHKFIKKAQTTSCLVKLLETFRNFKRRKVTRNSVNELIYKDFFKMVLELVSNLPIDMGPDKFAKQFVGTSNFL